jgi:hypothetical protein
VLPSMKTSPCKSTVHSRERKQAYRSRLGQLD